MSRIVKKEKEPDAAGLAIVYTRVHVEDLAEMKRREQTTGATVAAQIRILIHEGLRARREFK